MTAPPRFTRPDHIARPDHNERADGEYHPDRHRLDRATDTLPVAEEEQRLKLSATQIMASMAAAVTAALVGSTLGVAGTVIGAGLASVISVVGGAIFGHSIVLTRKQVKRAVLQVRGADREQADRLAPDDDRTVVIPAVTRFDLPRPVYAQAGPERRSAPDRSMSSQHSEPRRPRPTRRKLGAGLLVGVAAAATIFAGSLAAVTLVETVKGSPLSGGDSGGLSVLGGNSGADSKPVVEVPVTTNQVTEVSTVTQTMRSEPTDTAPVTSEPGATSPAQSSSQGSPTTGSSRAASGSASTGATTTPSPAASSPVADAANRSGVAATATGSAAGTDALGR
jgi:hypothetical protein